VLVERPEPPLFCRFALRAADRTGLTDRVFEVSDAMRRYVQVDIANQLRTKGTKNGLIEALYQKSQLKLEYDARMTKTAAEAFATRSGNCLSLVIMTAALAKELRLPVYYQSAILDETWSRTGSLLFASGHVNITLGHRSLDGGTSRDLKSTTIDFLPPEETRGMRTPRIDEETVVAMYANNRAAEALVGGRLDDAYAWTREALRRDPSFMSAFNTLGVVYLHHGDVELAARAFERVLASEPANTRALANMAETRDRQGRSERPPAERAPREDRVDSAVPLLQPRHGGDEAQRLPERTRLLRARGGTRRLLPRVPLLARRRRLAARRRRRRPQAPEDRDVEQHDARPARPVRGQAGLAAGARGSVGAAGAGRPCQLQSARSRAGSTSMPIPGAVPSDAKAVADRLEPRAQRAAQRIRIRIHLEQPVATDRGQQVRRCGEADAGAEVVRAIAQPGRAHPIDHRPAARDAAPLRDVGLDHRVAARRDRLVERLEAEQVLAGGERDRRRGRERRPFRSGPVGAQRLLDPAEPMRLERTRRRCACSSDQPGSRRPSAPRRHRVVRATRRRSPDRARRRSRPSA
jgi:tetratricopeptide (TPR) repeat protein